ncbi:MAG: radical SAM protein [Armatimonadota bacterium]
MHLTLHLTARCNLRCRYCYAEPHSGGDMTLDTIKSAISMAMNDKKTPDESLGVIFFGGEPLLKRDLIAETVRHCRRIEAETGQMFHFKMTTNGTLLDEEFLTNPDTSGIFVALSHDGIRSAHDMNRLDAEGKGSFDALEPKINLLLSRRPYAPVMMVITPDTVRWYADSVKYLYGRGFKYLICSLNYGAEWTERHVAELGRQYNKLAGWYYEEILKEEKFYFSPFEVKIASHVYPGSCKAERCELGKTQISVAPNGRLYPCVQFVGDGSDEKYAIGHVKLGVDEEARARLYAWNGEEKSTCAECAIRERCNHYCGCLNKQATGSIDQVSPMLCVHERTILPIADRLAERLFKRRDPLFIQKHYNDMFPLISLVEDRTG